MRAFTMERSHRTGRTAAVVALLAGAAAAVALVMGACADPDTVTPDCAQGDACAQFPTCLTPDGSVDVTYCCGNGMGDGGLTGNDYLACRHGYGDPTCAYLDTENLDGGGVVFTCLAAPPSDGGGPVDSGGGG